MWTRCIRYIIRLCTGQTGRCEKGKLFDIRDSATGDIIAFSYLMNAIPNFHILSSSLCSHWLRLLISTSTNWTLTWIIWVRISKTESICACWWVCWADSLCHYTTFIWHRKMPSKWSTMLVSHLSWCKTLDCRSLRLDQRILSIWTWSQHCEFFTAYSQNIGMWFRLLWLSTFISNLSESQNKREFL